MWSKAPLIKAHVHLSPPFNPNWKHLYCFAEVMAALTQELCTSSRYILVSAAACFFTWPVCIVVAQLLCSQPSHGSVYFLGFLKVCCLHLRSWMVFTAPHLVFNTSSSQQAKPSCWQALCSITLLTNPCSPKLRASSWSYKHLLLVTTWKTCFKHFNPSCCLSWNKYLSGDNSAWLTPNRAAVWQTSPTPLKQKTSRRIHSPLQVSLAPQLAPR